MAARTTEERLAHLEGAYEHLATKADIERVVSTLTWRMIIALALWGGVIIAAIKLLPA